MGREAGLTLKYRNKAVKVVRHIQICTSTQQPVVTTKHMKQLSVAPEWARVMLPVVWLASSTHTYQTEAKTALTSLKNKLKCDVTAMQWA
jgi:hypothetical protein